MSAEQDVTVQIYHQAYQLSSSNQSPEFIRRAAAYLDAKMHAAAASAGDRSSLDVAILASLEIAEEVLQQRQRKEAMLDQVGQRISRFTRRLEDEGDFRG